MDPRWVPDLVNLTENIFAVPEREISRARVWMTNVASKLAFAAC